MPSPRSRTPRLATAYLCAAVLTACGTSHEAAPLERPVSAVTPGDTVDPAGGGHGGTDSDAPGTSGNSSGGTNDPTSPEWAPPNQPLNDAGMPSVPPEQDASTPEPDAAVRDADASLPSGDAGTPPSDAAAPTPDAEVPPADGGTAPAPEDITLVRSSPEDEATNVDMDLTELELEYSAPLQASTGRIALVRTDDGTVLIDVSGDAPEVSVQEAFVRVSLPDLAADTDYHVTVADDALLGQDGISPVIGFTGSDTLNFRTAPAPVVCAGTSVDGLCWYLAPLDVPCETHCAAHGGVDPAMLAVVGSTAQGGTPEACAQVLTALGHPEPVLQGFRIDGRGLGCHRWSDGVNWWLDRPDLDPADHAAPSRSACACVD